VLFRQSFLEGIRNGGITVAFRRWRRPTVTAGGTLLTPVGQLQIRSVSPVDLREISAGDARRAGFDTLASLLSELNQRKDGEVFRIEIGPLCEDPRIAMRESLLSSAREHDEMRQRLQRLDAHSSEGPWTIRTLEAIRVNPGLRAADLCLPAGQPKERLKLNVRKLKNLGLTESLGTGYRLSPRGEEFLRRSR